MKTMHTDKLIGVIFGIEAITQKHYLSLTSDSIRFRVRKYPNGARLTVFLFCHYIQINWN
jgi:hypothetical protein